MLKNPVLPPHTLGAFLPVMSKQSRGIFQQEELSHVRSEAGTKHNRRPKPLACSIRGPPAAPPLRAGMAATHLLEVVRLEELAVIQQVCQMGHKPPVA